MPAYVRTLIRRIASENRLWRAPRIQAELRLLGHDLAESTVARSVKRPRRPHRKRGRRFSRTMPTAWPPSISSIAHFAVTEQPHAAWAAQQLKEAFPFDEAPHYLIRDNDGIYGHEISRCLESMGVEEVKTASHSPWQNSFVERLVGTLRHECLDHVIVLNEQHLQRILRAFIDGYYHPSRCHMALDDNSPLPRKVEPSDKGGIVVMPVLGGLHHAYRRAG